MKAFPTADRSHRGKNLENMTVQATDAILRNIAEDCGRCQAAFRTFAWAQIEKCCVSASAHTFPRNVCTNVPKNL